MDMGPNSAKPAEILRFRDCELDLARRELRRAGQLVRMQPTPLRLLLYLAEHRDRTVSRDELLGAIWSDVVVGDESVTRALKEARRGVGDDGESQNVILTQRGVGFRFTADLAIEASPSPQAHLIRFGSRSALVCTPDSSARSDAELSLLESLVRDLLARAGQRSDVSARAIKVPSRNPAVEDHAAELGADYTARIDAQADAERLTVALVITPAAKLPAHHERFEAPFAERMRFLDDTAAHILEDLLTLLDDRALQGMREWGTKNVRAYRSAVAAELLRTDWDYRSLTEAARWFREAIAADPRFSRGYLELTHVYGRMAGLATDAPTREELRLAVQGLQKEALRLAIDPNVIHAMADSNRYLAATSAFDVEARTRAELVRKTEDAGAIGVYAGLLCGAGFFDESERYLERAISMDAHWEVERSTLLGARGRFAEHVVRLKLELERHPNSTFHLFGLVQSLAVLGRFQEAEAFVERMRATDPGFSYSAKLTLRAIRGDFVLGSGALERVLSHPTGLNVNRGTVCFVVGDVERGVEFWRDIEPMFSSQLWRFQSQKERFYARGVVEDPRYQDLLDYLGIGHRWKSYLWECTQELAPITGIPVTTPRPIRPVRADGEEIPGRTGVGS